MAPSRAALRRAAARGPRAYLGEPAAGPRPAPVAAPNQLEALKKMSRVVADTGEIDQVKLFPSVYTPCGPPHQNMLNECLLSPVTRVRAPSFSCCCPRRPAAALRPRL